jgi:hypothetical protein
MAKESLIKAKQAASTLGGQSGSARDAILKRKKALQAQLDAIDKELG